jgi:hypothetical protein
MDKREWVRGHGGIPGAPIKADDAVEHHEQGTLGRGFMPESSTAPGTLKVSHGPKARQIACGSRNGKWGGAGLADFGHAGAFVPPAV